MSLALRASFVLLIVGAGCFSTAREGETCSRTSDCSTDLECVAVFDDRSVCLPQPDGRAPQACDNDDDCVFSTGDQWPVEVECLDRSCRCIVGEARCGEDGSFEDENGNELVLEPETCRCLSPGGEGDSCLTALTCLRGFGCERSTLECRSPVSSGSTCKASDECESDVCTPGNDSLTDVGTCE